MEQLPQEALDAPQPLIAQVLVEALQENAVPAPDVEFVTSLIDARKKYGHWTNKQDFWARAKYAKVLGLVGFKPHRDYTGYQQVLDNLKKAGQKLLHPKIHLVMEDGEPLVLSLHKSQDKITLTDGEAYPLNAWYGYVVEGGNLILSKHIDPERKAKVLKVMMAYKADPVGTVASYGHQTGRCSFCHKTLTDPQSVAAGYGPVCAKKYGLLTNYKAAQTGPEFTPSGGDLL